MTVSLGIELSLRSVSQRQLILEIPGKAKVRCVLKRHLSPRTVGIILRSIPLEGHAHLLGKSVLYFETHIDAGNERPRKEFKKGDVAFMPSPGTLCFFLADAMGKSMTLIGSLAEDVDSLKDAASGDVLCLYEAAG